MPKLSKKKETEVDETVDWTDTETHLNVEVKNHIEEPEDGDIQVIWEFDMFVGNKPTITRKVRKFDGGYRSWRNVGRKTYEPSEYKDTAPEQVQDVFDGIYVSE